MPKFTALINKILLTNLRVLISNMKIALTFHEGFCSLTNSRVVNSNMILVIIIKEYFLDFKQENQYCAVQRSSG